MKVASKGFSVMPLNGHVLQSTPKGLKQSNSTKVSTLSKFLSKIMPSPYESKPSALRGFMVEAGKMLQVQVGLENMVELIDKAKDGHFKKLSRVMSFMLGQEETNTPTADLGARARSGPKVQR